MAGKPARKQWDFVPQKMLRDTEKRANNAQQVPLSILILSSGMAPKALTDEMSVDVKSYRCRSGAVRHGAEHDSVRRHLAPIR
jgi:hypothetical protein